LFYGACQTKDEESFYSIKSELADVSVDNVIEVKLEVATVRG